MVNMQIPTRTRRAIANAYGKGLTSIEVGEKYKVSPSTVLQIVREEGGEVRSKRIPDRTRRAIANAYAKGTPTSRIAAKFDVQPATVLKIVREFGAIVEKAPTVQPPTAGELRRIARAYAKGGSAKTVGDQFGVEPAVVLAAARQHDVPIRYGRSKA